MILIFVVVDGPFDGDRQAKPISDAIKDEAGDFKLSG